MILIYFVCRKHWLKNNINRLAMTFRRPVLGIHNRTNGILFDVVECLIQRSFGYATDDVRICYPIILKTLRNPEISKVVFILHSQGCIEGGLVIDWLLQELPQDLLSKLEVYTFGNAANHWNNPFRHIESQIRARRSPLHASVDSFPTAASSRDHHTPPLTPTKLPGTIGFPQVPPSPPQDTIAEKPDELDMGGGTSSHRHAKLSLVSETSAPQPTSVSGRVIGHIEHYAHTTDFVALWGVLQFAKPPPPGKPASNRGFSGRIFARKCDRGGHQFNQHYLDGMFPLTRNDDGTHGCHEEGNEFMEYEVEVGADEYWHNSNGEDSDKEQAFYVGDGIPADSNRGRHRTRTVAKPQPVKMKIKDLSRLWQYRNGKSPGDEPPRLTRDATGTVRNATM
jgi:hypothetical protein